jgi:septin family protein
VASAEIFVLFFFFLLDSFKERMRARQREKRQGFETYFSALLVGLNVTQKLPFVATVVATCAPSGSNNTTPVVTTQELQKCKKSVTFNMKQQEIEFF